MASQRAQRQSPDGTADRDRTVDAAARHTRRGNWSARLARGAVIALIYVYQGVASVFPKGACRFEPSCSAYGLEAVRVHGAAAGGWLTLKRILRCRPGGGFGVDPVPPAPVAPAPVRPADDAERGCGHPRHDHPAGRREAR